MADLTKRPGSQTEAVYQFPFNPSNSIARGRTMEAMLAFVRPSPCRLNPSAAAASVEKVCTCERPSQNILCKSCGYVCKGRVQKRCVQHFDVIHLMDISACPSCQSTSLKEFGTPKK